MNPMAGLRKTCTTTLPITHPVLDFLLPSWRASHKCQRRLPAAKAFTTTTPNRNGKPSHPDDNATQQKPPLSKEQSAFLDSALRVNQAGELAATLIYTHQTPPILKTHPHLRSLMAHMYSQEAGHFGTFNHLLAKHRVRPTAMYPVWVVAASVLGWSTGLMGREVAMACTEAVETEIGMHYNDQVRVLLDWVRDMEERGQGHDIGEEITVLVKDLKRIRDEELEHLEEAVGEGAKEARPYELLNKVIRTGCRGAIWISQRV